MQQQSRLISLVVPFFNEGETVDHFFASLSTITQSWEGYRHEIICVDDGSGDDTLQRLDRHAAMDQRIKIVALSRNFGKEAALTAGIDHASGDAVIPLDADLQDPPELIMEMLRLWEDGAEVVVAHRVSRASDSLLKRTSAGLFYKLHNRLSNIKIPENVGDFRLMDRSVVNALQRLPETQRFMKGLFAWVGFKTQQLDYVRPTRVSGNTKFSGWRLWNFALEGITSFSTAPLRVWTYLGALTSVLALFYLVFVITLKVAGFDSPPGYSSLLAAVLFLGGIQLTGIGVLGEYIGRIYNESKQRPVYIVRRFVNQGEDL